MSRKDLCTLAVAAVLAIITQAAQRDGGGADALFATAKFNEADVLYREKLAKEPNDFQLLARVGELALLRNDLTEGIARLRQALAQRSQDARVKSLLAEALYR